MSMFDEKLVMHISANLCIQSKCALSLHVHTDLYHLKSRKNCQNGTFLPMHENQKFFGPNVFISCSKQ